MSFVGNWLGKVVGKWLGDPSISPSGPNYVDATLNVTSTAGSYLSAVVTTVISVITGGGGGQGWVLQQFSKRPWELERKEVEAAYRRLVNNDVVAVKKVVKPFVHGDRINWTELMSDLKAVETIVKMEIKRLEDEEEEELLIMLLS
jgi:hypothetical protein